MKDGNTAVDLQFVGHIDEVVLGLLGVGGDVFDNMISVAMEFAGDQPESTF